MAPETLKLLCLVLAFFGVALCFVGYRIFRVCLAAAGLLFGLWVGILLAEELFLEGLSRTLIVAGISLLGAVLAAAIYHLGVFITGGAALGGAVLLVSTRLGHPVSVPVLGGVFAAGGILAVAAHRSLVIYATSLVGALLVLAGLAPLIQHSTPPEAFDTAWLRDQVKALPAAWLVAGAALAVAGILAQGWAIRRRGMGYSYSPTVVVLPPEAVEPRRTRARRAPESRTHGGICPRCGCIVDVDALLCHQCGNDRWD